MKKRDTLKIIGDMLSLSIKGIRKTNLMRASNISFELLKKYTDMLSEWNLIDVEDSGVYLTPKGYLVLKLIKKLEELDNEKLTIVKELERLLPVEITKEKDLPPVEKTDIERVKSLLGENGIQYREEEGAIYVDDLEICEEQKCRGEKVFFNGRRLLIGRKFSVLVESGRVRVVYNEDLPNLLWEKLRNKLLVLNPSVSVSKL